MEGFSEDYEEEETLASLRLSIALLSSGTLRVFDGAESPSLARARHHAAEHLSNGGKELGHALADAAHSAEHALHHTKHHHARDVKVDVDMPKVDIDVPKVDVPDVHLHAHDLPKVDIDVPKVDVPEVKVHDMKAEVDVPKVDVPKVDIPKPKVKLPKAKISKIFKGIKHKLPMASRAIGINIDIPQHLPGLFAVTGELIRPGPPEITGLPLRNEYDETQTNFWDEYRKPYAGQILFSSKPIDRFFQREELKTRFEAGSDIHARAVFPRALRNYPIAHKKGKPEVPVYGPKFILAGSCRELNLHALQVFVFVSVDGKPVGRELKWQEEVISGPLMMSTEVGPKPPGSFSRNDDACRKYAENFSPETVDFWAMNQSMVFGLVRKDYNMADTWDQGIPLLMKTLAQLPPGEHKVEVDFRFRLVANEETCVTWRTQGLLPASECFPEKGTTPISHPIARGEFIYAITAESAASALAASNPLPKRSTKLPDAEADRLEKLILEVMKESPDWGNRRVKTERILKVVITGEGWHKLGKTHFCTPLCLNPCPVWANEPRKYALDFVAVVYRSPLDGWPEEMPCVAFDLGAAAYDTTPQNKRDIVRIGVGNNWEIDVDMIPESAFEEAGLKRCPAAVRRGFAK